PGAWGHAGAGGAALRHRRRPLLRAVAVPRLAPPGSASQRATGASPACVLRALDRRFRGRPGGRRTAVQGALPGVHPSPGSGRARCGRGARAAPRRTAALDPTGGHPGLKAHGFPPAPATLRGAMSRLDQTLEGDLQPDERRVEQSLRPRGFGDYVGQSPVIEKLKVYVAAARGRDDALDHCLFSGPPGLGKTSLAHIIGAELGAGVHVTSGPALQRKGHLAGPLTHPQPRDALLIDEIPRLNAAMEAYLPAASGDFRLDFAIDTRPAARPTKIDPPLFTLVGATTR